LAAPEVEAAIGRAVRIGIERDVGDRVILAAEPGFARQVLLHHRERLVAPLLQPRQLGAPRRVGGEVAQDEARHRDVRLVAVLFEEHPLQRARAAGAVARQ